MPEREEVKARGMWLVATILVAILALGLSIWGAITFAMEGGEKWSWGRMTLALGYNTWAILGGISWFIGTILFVMELTGHTIRRGKIVKFNMAWDSIDISIIALTAAVYGGALAATGGLTIIPGATWIRPANALPPVFGVLFGLPGCIGTALGNFLADAFAGYLGWGSIGGFIGNFILAYVPYKMVSDPSLREQKAWFEFYASIIISSIWCSAYISWWLYVWGPQVSPWPLVGLPAMLVWGWFFPFVIVNNLLLTAIISAPITYILYPVVRNWGLLWNERIKILL